MNNKQAYDQLIAEHSRLLSSNMPGMYLVGAYAHMSVDDIRADFRAEAAHYRALSSTFIPELRREIPEIIVSDYQGAIYIIIDGRNIDMGVNPVTGVRRSFVGQDFVNFCAQHGNADGRTVLFANMDGFYSKGSTAGRAQVRAALVPDFTEMEGLAQTVATLIHQYRDYACSGAIPGYTFMTPAA